MTTDVTFVSGDRSPPADPRGIPCMVLPTASGVVGTSYTLDPGDDVIATLGAGKAAFWALLAHAGAGTRLEVCAATPTWTSLSGDLTKSGSGPDIALSNATSFSGAADDLPNFKIKVTTAGALGVAAGDVYNDGTNVAENVLFPQEAPAVLRGDVDISSAVPAMTGLTLIHTSPAGTVAFITSPTTPEELVTTFDALADAVPLAVHGRIHETAAGEKFFEIVSDVLGAAAAVQLNATSTGDATLGLAATAAAGAAATLTLPNSGVKLTFDAGTYVLNETYTRALVGPTMSLASQIAGATAALANFEEHPFGYLVFPEQASHVAAATLAGSIATLVADAAADPDAPIFIDFLIGSAFHTASSTVATNNTNIGTSDSDFAAAYAGLSPSRIRNFAHDDCYCAAPAGLPAGRFRRSAALAGVIKRSALDRLAGNPGQKPIPLVSLLAADGLTRARDESAAVTKLGRKSGKAWCLKSINKKLGNVKFEISPTGAGSSSRFWDPGVVAIANSLAAAAVAHVQEWEGESWETDPEDPSAVLPDLATTRADELERVLDAIAKPANKPANISGDISVTITAATLNDDGDVQVAVAFNTLGVPQTISITITATGAVISE